MSTEVGRSSGHRAATVAVAVLLTLLSTGTAQASEGQMESEVAAAINAERQARGHAALPNEGNIAYARQRARAQPDGGTDGHAGFDWETAAGDPSGAAMENLAWSEHGNGARHAVRRWMESDPHRTPILAPNADRLAVGVDCRDGQWVIVVHVVWDDYDDHAADTHGSPPPAAPRLADSGGTGCEPGPQGTSPGTPPPSTPSGPPSPQPSEAPVERTQEVRHQSSEEAEQVTAAEQRRVTILAGFERFCPESGDEDASIRERGAACLLGFEVVYLVADDRRLSAPQVQTLHGIAAIHSGLEAVTLAHRERFDPRADVRGAHTSH